MLNYVWLALLILGIGAAVTTDVINQSKNKYRNNEPIPVKILFSSPYEKNKDTSYATTVIIKNSDFNKFYSEKVDNDVVFPARISVNTKEGKKSLFFNINDKSPKIFKEIAGVTGDDDDITGKIRFSHFSGDSLAQGFIILEEVSFTKLKDVTNSALSYASTAVNIAIGLIGIMALWLGVMKVAEEAGLISIIARWLKPVTTKLFPDVPADHPAMGSMIMNISANMLGLGNAATPFGLKAMEELDKLNPNKGTATNAMVTFLAINTAGMTLIPATAIAIRASAGSSDPAIIIGTSLFGAFCATVMGLTSAKILEKFPIKKGEFGAWLRSNLKGFLVFISLILIAALIILTGLGSLLGSVFNFVTPDLFKSVIQFFSIIAIPF